MSLTGYLASLALAWLIISTPFAVLIGRVIRLADERDTCVCCDETVEVAA